MQEVASNSQKVVKGLVINNKDDHPQQNTQGRSKEQDCHLRIQYQGKTNIAKTIHSIKWQQLAKWCIDPNQITEPQMNK